MVKRHLPGITVLVLLNFIFSILHDLFVVPAFEVEVLPVVSVPASYVVNAIASLGMCTAILVLKKKYESQIGFVFLGLSIVKMILLFFLLNPTSPTGDVLKIDALAFFIPFGLNLILEQIFIVKLLKINDLVKVFNEN